MVIQNFWGNLHKNIPYQETFFKDEIQLGEWKKSGHAIEKTTIHINQNFKTQDFLDIETYFKDLSNIQIAFHCLKPGHYLPTHIDRYGFYIKKHNILDHNTIKRYVIFLENWADGHLLVVDGKVYSQWQAGQVVGWHGQTPHSAINLGTVDRYTLQITGVAK